MDKQSAHQLNVQKSVMNYLFLLFALLPLSTPGALAEGLLENQNNASKERAFLLPPDHQSQYSIEKYGSRVGMMKNELLYKEGVIHYSSIAKAKGLAALFIKDDPKETSLLNWPDDKSLSVPEQQSFSYIQGKKHKKNQQALFIHTDTDKTRIEGSYKFKPYTLQTDKIVWGRQLLPLLMSSDLQLNPEITSNSFYITDKGHLQKYTYTLEANESIEFKNKKQPVLKFKLNKENSRRMSYVWLSPAHFYLPLKIEQYKNDKLNVRMLMTHLKLN